MAPCSYCGKPGANKQCTACHSVTYCGVECQRGAWKAHKKACKEIQRLRKSAPTGDAIGHSDDELQPDKHPFSGASLAAREIVIVAAYAGFTEAPPVMPMTWRVLPDDTFGHQLVRDRLVEARLPSGGRITLCQQLVEALILLEHAFFGSCMARLAAKHIYAL